MQLRELLEPLLRPTGHRVPAGRELVALEFPALVAEVSIAPRRDRSPRFPTRLSLKPQLPGRPGTRKFALDNTSFARSSCGRLPPSAMLVDTLAHRTSRSLSLGRIVHWPRQQMVK